MPEQDTKLNAYNAQIGHFSKHHPTLSPSNEVREKFVHRIPSSLNVWISDLSATITTFTPLCHSWPRAAQETANASQSPR